jgi:hypothetical protein
MSQTLFQHFCTKYAELEETCYRAAVAGRSPHGRLRGRYTVPAPLVKKMDIDRALAGIYQKFFGDAQKE